MPDKRQFATRVTPDLLRKLRILAAERETTVQALIEEAITNLLRKYQRRS